MEKNLADVITELNKGKKTGILSVSIKNDNCLFKMFFRDGAVYHMTHGTCRDVDCLVKLEAMAFEAGFFMAGAQIDVKDRSIPETEAIIEVIRKAGKAIRWGDDRPEMQPDKPRSAVPAPNADVYTLDSLERELVNIVGPVATMILESAYSVCNLTKGVPISKIEFVRLIDRVCERLPEEQKALFRAKYPR